VTTHASPAISVCIVCRNEADKLAVCLPSVAWADEVVLMDLSSEDGSAAIAVRFGARVVHRAPVPVVEKVRNEVAAYARNDWILAIDPDERVSPGLAAELARVAGRIDIDAVMIPRRNVDFGFEPSHWMHRFEPQLRMYRRSTVRFPEEPNAPPSVPVDRVYRVPPRDDLALVHDRNRNVAEVLDRVLRYAPAQGQWMAEHGPPFTARRMLSVLGGAAYHQFLLARPWRDGVPGIFRAAVLMAFKTYVWLAFWQLSGSPRTAADDRCVRHIGALFEIPRFALRTLRAPWWLARRARALSGRCFSMQRSVHGGSGRGLPRA